MNSVVVPQETTTATPQNGGTPAIRSGPGQKWKNQIARHSRLIMLSTGRSSALGNARFRKGSRYDLGWFVTRLGFRKENHAADCNFKLSFQRDWRWYR